MVDFAHFDSRITVTAKLKAVTDLHVGAGRAISPIDTDLPIMKDILGRPYIPGSSIKGPIRSYLSSLLHALEDPKNTTLVCDEDYEARQPAQGRPHACVTLTDVDTWRTLPAHQRDTQVLGKLCLTCRVFGSPWMASKVKFRDATVDESTWHKSSIRDGVMIDRDKGTAVDGAKYDYEIVPAETLFDLRIQMDNGADDEIGLLLLGVQALREGQILLGGAHRAGTGWCKLEKLEVVEIRDPLDLLKGNKGYQVQEKPYIDAVLASIQAAV